ncbi:MAG TPA: diaminopimelate decarboxylase [Gemmatimonadaceae bacterium]|nr:diaminopimelate decarboxylase [Gemmatimonadaceae bacterium]
MGESLLVRAGFWRDDTALTCEGVSLERVASEVGTPAYVYSAGAIRGQYAALDAVLTTIPHRVHYSVKANSNGAVLTLLRDLGAGVDIVSGGELYRALRAGFRGCDVVFSGVGKTEQELREALEAGVLLMNVESEAELRLLNDVATRLGRDASVALRVNPEVTVDTPHPYTRTGERGMKFGIPADEALETARLAMRLPHVRLAGVDMHIGSQVAQATPYVLGVQRLLALCDRVRSEGGDDLQYFDIGGGFAVPYQAEPPTDLAAFVKEVLPPIAATGFTLLVEPGRFLVANAGVLLTRVLYRKRSGGRDFVIVDAGMNDLIRPSHYQAYHRIEAVRPVHTHRAVDIVGPVCESGDSFAAGRELDDVQVGDLVAIHSAGAYGASMSSNYNSRVRAAEVLVDGERFAVTAQRECYEDLVRQEPAELDWRRG